MIYSIIVILGWLPLLTCDKVFYVTLLSALRWSHNGRDSVSNHQPHDCLLNLLFRRRSKKASKLCVTDLCVGNSPGTVEFPAHMASNVENASIWWRHHGLSSTAHPISLEAVPYLRWTWRLIHMKSIWNHICIPSHEICVLYVRIYCELRMYFIWSSYELLMNFIWSEINFIHTKFKRRSYELHMEFKWTCHEFHMKLNQIYSYEFTCSSYEIHMNFISKN